MPYPYVSQHFSQFLFWHIYILTIIGVLSNQIKDCLKNADIAGMRISLNEQQLENLEKLGIFRSPIITEEELVIALEKALARLDSKPDKDFQAPKGNIRT